MGSIFFIIAFSLRDGFAIYDGGDGEEAATALQFFVQGHELQCFSLSVHPTI